MSFAMYGEDSHLEMAYEDRFYIPDDGYEDDGYDPFCDDEDEEDEPFTDGPLKGKMVKVEGYNGVAWSVVEDDGSGFAVCVMIGDDRRFVHDRNELTVLDEDEFCDGCGQLGCGWGC